MALTIGEEVTDLRADAKPGALIEDLASTKEAVTEERRRRVFPRTTVRKKRDKVHYKRSLAQDLAAKMRDTATIALPFAPITATITIMQAEDLAIALDELAKENEYVYKALELSLEASAFSGVITAGAPIAMAAAYEFNPVMRPWLSPAIEEKIGADKLERLISIREDRKARRVANNGSGGFAAKLAAAKARNSPTPVPSA